MLISLLPDEMGGAEIGRSGRVSRVRRAVGLLLATSKNVLLVHLWSHCPDAVTSCVHLHTEGHQVGTVCLFGTSGNPTQVPLPP